jgi:hypothetical protein
MTKHKGCWNKCSWHIFLEGLRKTTKSTQSEQPNSNELPRRLHLIKYGLINWIDSQESTPGPPQYKTEVFTITSQYLEPFKEPCHMFITLHKQKPQHFNQNAWRGWRK